MQLRALCKVDVCSAQTQTKAVGSRIVHYSKLAKWPQLLPDRVVLEGELSQASTHPVPSTLALACSADKPVAAMRPPLSPWVSGNRPRCQATVRVCFLVKHPLAYPQAISPAEWAGLLILKLNKQEAPCVYQVRKRTRNPVPSHLTFARKPGPSNGSLNCGHVHLLLHCRWNLLHLPKLQANWMKTYAIS